MSSDRLARIFPEPLVVETIAEGFATAEGPVWCPESGRLIFSDIGLVFDNNGITPRHMGRRYQFDPGIGEVTLLIEGTNRANGMVRDAQGRLLACEIEGHSVTRTDADGRRDILADACDGMAFGVPNDVVVATNGRIYFTDSGNGPPSGVYCISTDGTVQLVARDFRVANGLAFSPDERRLYVNDSMGLTAEADFWMSRGAIRVYDVEPDGTLSSGREFAKLDGTGSGTADGMKTDAQGNVYCAGPRGIWVLDAEGELLGVIETGVVHNKTNVTNFTWGGKDAKTLFVTTSTSLLQLRAAIR